MALQKVENFEVFVDRGPDEKNDSLLISHFLHISHPDGSIVTFSCPMVNC